MSIWDDIKDTAESLGGAAVAPVGAIYDLASAPFDGEDDNFGTILNKLAGRAGDVLDPLVNTQTLTGFVPGHALEGANWLLDYGVNRPISTALTLSSHADTDGWGAFFSGDDWARAWDISDTQNAGQSFAYTFGDKRDPFADADKGLKPYDQFAKDHPGWAPTLSWGANVVGAWYLDPLVMAGKVGAVHRELSTFAKMSDAEKGVLFNRIAEGGARQSRVDKWLDWVGGANAKGEALSGPEILYATPELRTYSSEPHVIAGLIADAGKIADPMARRDAQRRILAVAAGDTSQIQRLGDEIEGGAALADQLKNMLKGGSIDLQVVGANPIIKHDPAFIHHLEQQLHNLNDDGAIDKFMRAYDAKLSLLSGTEGSLHNLPGVHRNLIPGVNSAADRAVLRLNDAGKGRALKKGHEFLEGKAAEFYASTPSTSSVFQKGLHAAPLVVVKTVGLPASIYTKFPVAFSDALRQTHFTGMANLHDWGAATTQLDSMMKLAEVAPGERMDLLSKAFIATSEADKQRLIDQAEKLSMGSLAKSFGAKYGHDIDHGFIETLMENGARGRSAQLAQIKGRAYAAAKMSPDMMATRGKGIQGAEDAASKAASRDKFAMQADDGAAWRVDQINDDGTLLALPVLSSQLGNTVPLLDMEMAKRVLDRHFTPLARASRAWLEESKELGRLNDLKLKGVTGLERSIRAREAAVDMLVDYGQRAMRLWKFSVLFRLGYPLRVIADDHMRIWTQMNAMSFYMGNLKEMGANFRGNRSAALFGSGTRGSRARLARNEYKVRRQEIKDILDSDLARTYDERLEDLNAHNRSLRGHRASLTRLRKSGDAEKISAKEATIAEMEATAARRAEELGDFDPDRLKAELSHIDSFLDQGLKPFLDAKSRIGSRGVDIGDGMTAPGAFAPGGETYREFAGSHGTFTHQLEGVERRTYSEATRGSFQTLAPYDPETGLVTPGHLDAWADALNYQFRSSPEAMHFVKGGSVDEFVAWIKEPEQAALRRRVAHFAHDPEDWGNRINLLVHEYLPTDALREAVARGRVTPKFLAKQVQDPTIRPMVHGRAVADNLGTSYTAGMAGRVINRVYKALGEWPTDHLSRHPFFNSMYKQHVREHADRLRAGYAAEGKQFTQADVERVARLARKDALADVRRTLFDISAHSHAAHMLRFISPFFAAHQEVLNRWWRIVGDNPAVLRHFTQAFDLPRALGLVVDTNTGELVKPGDNSDLTSQKLLLQLPKAWGGDDPTKKQSKWQIGMNSFNLILQSGSITNPGAGPIVAVPTEFLAREYADEPELARVARVFNPFPPTSPMAAALPAWAKRFAAMTYGDFGVDPLFGIGKDEYNNSYAQNIQDLTVKFVLDNGREPNAAETDELMLKAGRMTNVDMSLRVINALGSPFPANPTSKYAAVQQGWYQISKQGDAEGKDFDWKVAQFKAKWGEAYMPLIYSSSNNEAALTGSPAEVAGIKRYKSILSQVDPKLTRMVIGAYAADQGAALNASSPEARAYLKDETMSLGSADTYFSYDEPAKAMEEQMARRGWEKYGELTAALTAQAQSMGLNSYMDSDELMAIKSAGVKTLREENWAFDKDYGNFDQTQFDRYITDMRQIVATPALAKDTERTDIQVLDAYLQLRDMFTGLLAQRDAAGGSADPQAQANADIRQVFTALVGQLVESNTYFEEYMFNGTLERDPLLEQGGVSVG